MKRFGVLIALLVLLAALPAGAQEGTSCTAEDITAAVDAAQQMLTAAKTAVATGDLETALTMLDRAAQSAADDYAACMPAAAAPATAVDPNAPVGSLQNPIPQGEYVATEDFRGILGSLMINSVERDAGAFVEEQNSFNPEADPGMEWVVVNVTVTCDMPAGELCEPGYFTINLKLGGASGVIYEKEMMASFGNAGLPQELMGGGEASGYVGFMIPQDETGLYVMYNPNRETRLFFAAE